MSRAFRIRVQESLKRVLRAHDRISTQLELLEILPAGQMGELLAEELKQHGFEEDGGQLVRTRDSVTVRVNPQTGIVVVEAEGMQAIDLSAEREGSAFDDLGPTAREVQRKLREDAQAQLENQARNSAKALQTEVTKHLEGHLTDLRGELNAVVNRVTAEALKQKAAQLGQIKELTEDPETGSLTIVVEV